MNPRRRGNEPIEAIEAGVCRLRLIGLVLLAAALALPSDHRPDAIGSAILVAIAGSLLVANRSSGRVAAGEGRVDRAVASQIGIDVVATAGTLVVLDPGPGDALWLLVALPVVEGAIRYGQLGALAVWLATAVPTLGWAIIGWAPGDGLSTMLQTGGILGVALAVALPAGLAGEGLVQELASQGGIQGALDDQTQLIATVAVAAEELAAATDHRLGPTLVEAAVELGFPGAELTVIDLGSGAQRLLASAPSGYATGALAGIDLADPALIPGTVVDGPIDELVGVVARTASVVAILAVGAEPGGRWRPRAGAFEVLCRSGAAAMAAAERRRQLAEHARHLDRLRANDPVTGLLNRSGFDAAVVAVLDRLAPGAEIRVVVVDVDVDSDIDGDLTRTAADEARIEIGARLQRSSPSGAGVGRIDSDRFAIVTDDRAAGDLAAHLRDILARPITDGTVVVQLRAWIGQVISADPTSDPAALLRQAEVRATAARGDSTTGGGTRSASGAASQP